MSAWVDYGITGIVWGLILCAVTVPLLAVAQKIFRNRLRAYWLLICAAVTIYLTGIFSFTMLPMNPAKGIQCATKGPQTVLFHSFVEAWQRTAGDDFLHRVTSFSFLQIFFNIVLFVPWGFMARAVFKRGIIVSTLTAFCMTLLIETTQLTGFWGYFPCAYRIFDVDDLFTNTLGGLLGAVVAALWIAGRRRPEKPLVMPRHVQQTVNRIK